MEDDFLCRGDREKMLLTLHLLPLSDRRRGDLSRDGDVVFDLGVYEDWGEYAVLGVPTDGTAEETEECSVSALKLLSLVDCLSLRRCE